MPHLPPDQFAHVFEPFRGRRVGFVRPDGNVGDLLIEKATFQLFEHFEIDWRYWRPGDPTDGIDELAFGGGGNMGRLYERNYELRGACLASGLPVTILPQSYLEAEDRPFRRVFVRERGSLAYAPGATLAPDLALGLSIEANEAPVHPLGVFIRRDLESVEKPPWYSHDPIKLADAPEAYLRLAAQYATIITNRLHMAIAGLLLDRRVVLLPNNYHKNKGVYDAWLAELGCGFAPTLREALEAVGHARLSVLYKLRHALRLLVKRRLHRWRSKRKRRRELSGAGKDMR